MTTEVFSDTGPQMPPLVGERIKLAFGAVLERPSAEVIAWLQARDPRVRYFPADVEAARQSMPTVAYAEAVSRRLGPQVQNDFPGVDVAVRGTVAALTESFAHDLWEDGADMRTVLDILASGSDSGADRTRVGHRVEEGELNYQTLGWLNTHSSAAYMELEGSERDQVFPVLLVYPPEAFEGEAVHGWNQLTGDPGQRLAAVYITDRIV